MYPLRRLRSRLALALVTLAAVLASACASTAPPAAKPATPTPAPAKAAGQPKSGGTLRIARPADAIGLDTRVAWDNPSFLAMELIYNPLVLMDTDLTIKPELATKWETSADGKVWTFTLRDDVTFHDGQKLTPADVVYTFNTMLDPKFVTQRKSDVAAIEKVEPVGANQVRLTLKTPFAELLDKLSRIGIVPKHVVEKVGNEKFNLNPVGTGPFKFVEWVKETRMVFEKNPTYWKKGLPYLDKVIMRPITEDSVRIAALEAGEIDLFQRNLDPDMADRLAKDERFVVEKAPFMFFYYVFLNLERVPAFKDKRVRQAIAYAIDRETIMKKVLRAGTPGTGPINPRSPYYNKDLPYYKYDPEKAKALLKEAGYDGGKLKFTFSTFTYPDHKKVGEVVHNNLTQVGIDAKLEAMDWGVFRTKCYPPQSACDAGNTGVNRIGPDAAIHPYFHSQGPENMMKFGLPQLDKQLDEGRITTDLDKRKGIYDQVVRTLVDESPMIFVGDGEIPAAMSRSVKGFTIHPMLSYQQLDKVWLDK